MNARKKNDRKRIMKNEWIVLYPKTKEKAYSIAGTEFVKYYEEMTGYRPKLSTDDDGVSNLVLIGAPAVNEFVAEKTLKNEIPSLNVRAGTDEFAVKTCLLGTRKIVLLQGGLGRSTLYAVYAYFEKLGCGWFWDGDVVPQKEKSAVEETQICLQEKPRFSYRGLRYFAHRGCKRFQAEMWDMDAWQKEIDYLLKRRLNMFMLRIGQDDLFQRAFPDCVAYPNQETMDELRLQNADLDGGYQDRRLFWPLEERGKLREQILQYAFDRGLMHPEDFGTMTHWYSLTPTDFIQKKQPDFFENNDAVYAETGAVWDIRKQRNFEYYMQLTDTHIREYGKAELFHTIGFAERTFTEDREKNLAMKKYVYDRYIQRIQEDHPNAPIFLASWDLWLLYKSDEVKTLLSSLDKTHCILLDYTSDAHYENDFTRWDVVGKIPYIFGIFHAYACYNDCLGDYPLTQERMEIAKADEFCKGLIFWPELSHSDTLMQEFFAQNAWQNQVVSVEESLKILCEMRYGNYAEKMQKIWLLALPIITLRHWSAKAHAGWTPEYEFFLIGGQFLPWLLKGEPAEKFADGVDMKRAKELVVSAKKCLENMRDLPDAVYQNTMISRDIADILRTLVSRYANVALVCEAEQIVSYRETKKGKERIYEYKNRAKELLDLLEKILSAHKDFSLYDTLSYIMEKPYAFKNFEKTLKNNTINYYCRTSIYESVKEVYKEEVAFAQQLILSCVESGKYDEGLVQVFDERSKTIVNRYLEKSLSETDKEEKCTLQQAIKNCAIYFQTLQF